MPHSLKERLIRASLAGLCLAGVLWIRSSMSSMSQMHCIGSFLMISCGIFFLQALSPEKGTSPDSMKGLPLDASFNSNEFHEAKKFMKSTVASRMRCQGSGIGSCGNGGAPRLKESTKLKDQTNFRQNDFSKSEKAGNYKTQHRREEKEAGNLNSECASSGPRLLECFRAGGRLLRRVYPRSIHPVEVPVPCKRGDAPEPQKAKSLEDVLPATATNHLKLVNQKQRMPEKKTSQLQKASSNSSTNCQSEGERLGRVRDATKFCVRPVSINLDTKPGSLDRDVATVQSFKNLESGPKTWRSRRGHSPRQYLMQKENICPAGTARVDKEAKKLQQLNYLRRLPCARNQPLQVATKHSYDGYGGIFIDPEFQDSPSEAFLEIVRMCERCETGHLEAMAALRGLQGSTPQFKGDNEGRGR